MRKAAVVGIHPLPRTEPAKIRSERLYEIHRLRAPRRFDGVEPPRSDSHLDIEPKNEPDVALREADCQLARSDLSSHSIGAVLAPYKACAPVDRKGFASAFGASIAGCASRIIRRAGLSRIEEDAEAAYLGLG